MHVVTKKIL